MRNDQVDKSKKGYEDEQFDHLEMHHTPGNLKHDEEKALPEKLIDLKNKPVHKPWQTIKSQIKAMDKLGNESVC